MTLYTWSALKRTGGEKNLNVTIFRDIHIFIQDRELRKNLFIRILIYFIYIHIYIYTRHIYTDFVWIKATWKEYDHVLYKVTVDQPTNLFLQQYIVDNWYWNCYYDDFVIIIIIMSTGLTWAENRSVWTEINNKRKQSSEWKESGPPKLMVSKAKG